MSAPRPTTEELAEGRRLLEEPERLIDLYHANPTSELWAAWECACRAREDWMVVRAPALLAAAERDAQAEGREKRLREALAPFATMTSNMPRKQQLYNAARAALAETEGER